ncbi:MAG: ComF family protein [Gammaproteobacteria bacterium]|nr:ComF family protein [Gammaproteobacteria bacterium]
MVYGWPRSGGGSGWCALCGQHCDDLGLCPGCQADLPYQGPACRRCALPLAASAGGLCGGCLIAPPPYDEVVAIFDYAEPVDIMIQRLKFDGRLIYARILGKIMAIELERRGARLPRMILPVPLHPDRLAARGFNQAVEIARPLVARYGIRLARTLCLRTRATAEQTGLDAVARRRNMRRAFSVTSSMAGADVVLLDDVMTTGSTLESLALAVRRAGAQRVAVWVCARAASFRRG